MYRTLLTTALVAILSLTGCGKKKESNESNSGFNTPSTLPADQQAQLAIKADMGSFLGSPMGKQAVESAGPEMPDFLKSATRVDVQVCLTPEMMEEQSKTNFYAKIEFSNADAAKAAFADIVDKAPAKDEELGGKSYKVIPGMGSPTFCVLLDGNSLVACSRAYAENGTTNFATDGLRSIMNGLEDDMLQVGIDLVAAKGLVQKLTAPMAQEKMVKPFIDGLMQVTGIKITAGMDEPLFMLGFDGADEGGVKNIQQQLQKGLGLLALTAGAVTPDEAKAPASAEMFSHILGCLTPQVEGNTVKVVITKPENFDDLMTKASEELKSGAALPPMMFGQPKMDSKFGDRKFEKKGDSKERSKE